MSSWNDTRFATAILCPAPLRAIWDQKSRRFVTENIELKSLVNDWHNYRIEIEFLNTHYGVDANGVEVCGCVACDQAVERSLQMESPSDE